MPLSLSLLELQAYTEEERGKWDEWFRSNPVSIFDIPMQPSGRFSTVWDLLDHIFIVEQRHIQRIRSQYPLPDQTGVARGDWPALFSFAITTRRQLNKTIVSITDEDAHTIREFAILDKTLAFTPRKLLFHVLIHEIRHWAQIAIAVHNAGFPPPGDHDFVFSSAIE